MYRVWNNERKEWIEDFVIEPNGQILVSDDYCGSCDQGKFSTIEDELTLIRETGLKDIEQFEEPKELYTGYIVSMHQFLFDGEEWESEIVGVLTYNEELAAVCLTNIQHHDIRKYMGYGNDKAEFKKEEIPICNFYGLHETSWTYLGNIYENPELLED